MADLRERSARSLGCMSTGWEARVRRTGCGTSSPRWGRFDLAGFQDRLDAARAGLRAVTLPRPLVAVLQAHVADYADDSAALVFSGDKGGPLRRSNFNRRVRWAPAVSTIGAAGLHFHDLRHTGNTLAAGSGASLRDLMLRMGHDSMRAALIYQHATANADQHIADALARHIDLASTAPDQAQPGDSVAPEQHVDSTTVLDDGNAGRLAADG